jgi:4-amino-4-deoxy-L-arabinose transferase-like glycosyltransferase
VPGADAVSAEGLLFKGAFGFVVGLGFITRGAGGFLAGFVLPIGFGSISVLF